MRCYLWSMVYSSVKASLAEGRTWKYCQSYDCGDCDEWRYVYLLDFSAWWIQTTSHPVAASDFRCSRGSLNYDCETNHTTLGGLKSSICPQTPLNLFSTTDAQTENNDIKRILQLQDSSPASAPTSVSQLHFTPFRITFTKCSLAFLPFSFRSSPSLCAHSPCLRAQLRSAHLPPLGSSLPRLQAPPSPALEQLRPRAPLRSALLDTPSAVTRSPKWVL